MTDPIIEALVQRRQQAGLSQGDIAERMGGWTQSEVSAIERGRDVRLTTLRRYAEALDTELTAICLEPRPHQRRPRTDNGRRRHTTRDQARTEQRLNGSAQ